jgi:hypothetical protein
LTLLTVFIIGYWKDNNKVTETKTELSSASANCLKQDKIQLKETFNEEDLPLNEYLTERLKPIRVIFLQINSIINWTSINTEELCETTEGRKAKFYYQSGQLEKIVPDTLARLFNRLTDYYLMNEQLLFVFEKSYKYKRPIYNNTIAIKENNDSEVFEFDKSELIEDQSNFEKERLIHQFNNQDCGSPYADDYLLEE